MARTVLWVGGMSGVGKTTAARRVARRLDLWLYSIDARTYAHAEAVQGPALRMTCRSSGSAVRRRYDNDAAVDQWRRYAEREPRARDLTFDFACECGRPGCEAVMPVSFGRTIHGPFLGHGATVGPWTTSA